MSDIRFMNAPADYERLNLDSKHVAEWEDGRRNDALPGHWEWWYFDAMLDDGSQVVIQFFPRTPRNKHKGDHPSYNFTLTLPDRTKLDKTADYPADQASFSQETCDVRFGKSQFTGNLHDYHIVSDIQDTEDGMGADLHLHSTSMPYRPGTGYFQFESDIYTWFCVVPQGEVTGTLTYNGQSHQVHGRGYHDHQWGSIVYSKLWNNWTWARQSFGDYSLLIFDMVASKKYQYERFPIAFVQNKDGQTIFESVGKVGYQLLEKKLDPHSNKNYPIQQLFTFTDGDKKLEYKLQAKRSIENLTIGDVVPKPVALTMRLLDIKVSYQRYKAQGSMKLTGSQNEDTVERSGELIYEFMYPGATNFDEVTPNLK